MPKTMRLFVAVCMVAVCAAGGFCQSTNSGDIRGMVLDSSGAPIAGVTVTLANIDTGESKDFVTNEIGIYDTVSTRPGNYKLTFTKAGFKQVTHGPVLLQVSVISVDATLAVGEVAEVVTVEDPGAPLLQTETGQQGRDSGGKDD